MSDYVPDANQEAFSELVDWTDWTDWNYEWNYGWENLEGDGGVEMGFDRALGNDVGFEAFSNWEADGPPFFSWSNEQAPVGDSGTTLMKLPHYLHDDYVPSEQYKAAAVLHHGNNTGLSSLGRDENSPAFDVTVEQTSTDETLGHDPVPFPVNASSHELMPADTESTEDQLDNQASMALVPVPHDIDTGKVAAVASFKPNAVPVRQGFVCPHESCTRTFARKHDVKRHLTTKHESFKPYKCPAFGCSKGRNAPAFNRVDKLKDHILRVHDETTIYRCPFEDCGVDLTSLMVCIVHLKKAHPAPHSSPNSQKVTTILRMAVGDKLSCPVTGCRTSWGYTEDLMAHLKNRHLDAISGHASAPTVISSLNDMHIIPSKFACDHGSSPGLVRGTHTCECSITDLTVRCPICGTIMSIPESPYMRNKLNTRLIQDHAQSLPENLADLRRNREAILRLLPSFGNDSFWNPVWEDIAHVVPPKKPVALEDVTAL